MFTTKTGCTAGKHVTDYYAKEPVMLNPRHILVGWTSKNYISDPSIEIKKTDIQQFEKLIIEENQPSFESMSNPQVQHVCAYFAVWRYNGITPLGIDTGLWLGVASNPGLWTGIDPGIGLLPDLSK